MFHTLSTFADDRACAAATRGARHRTNRGRARGIAGALALILAATALPALAAAPVEVTGFGSNPGNLRMFKYVPDGLPASAPLVVVLHGCKQNARDYATDAGWIQVADQAHAALAMAEQTQANNQNNCFNWFLQADNRRDRGEALSIRQMVDKMRADHSIDSGRIFVTGLSAGGAMTSVMLATYPEVFAGGGIVAGLPYGCANDTSAMLPTQALQCMQTGRPAGASAGLPGLPGLPQAASPIGGLSGSTLPPSVCTFFPQLLGCEPPTTAAEWGDFVRHASGHTGPFPRVSIWAGTADTTVNPVNADDEVLQWTSVHGVSPDPSAEDTVNGQPRAIFRDAQGRVVVESIRIAGMAHGVPVAPGTGADRCGKAADFVLDVGVCSSMVIARFWGIVE
ncbi:MAG TPA: PHB depolymerase family esterase [Crenalkalicoccus sp.]|nr:PHB depolymerase family esterase [Crenalkalicoccus sp.]